MAKNNTNRLAGLAYLTIDGKTYKVAGDMAWSPSKYSRETLVGMDDVHGYAEKVNAPHITCTLRDSGGLSVTDLNDMTSVTVIVELANGKTIIGRNMWTVETQESKATDATISVRWEGPEVMEVKG